MGCGLSSIPLEGESVVKLPQDFSDPREEIFKALACSTRIKILEILKEGEKCVCDLIPYFEIGQSAISRHLLLLKRAGLLVSRKDGVNVHYRLRDFRVLKLLEIAEELIKEKRKEEF